MSDKRNGNGKSAEAKNGKPARKRASANPTKAEIAERLKAEQEASAKRVAAILDELPDEPLTEAEQIEMAALTQGLDVESAHATDNEKLARLMRALRMPRSAERDAELKAAREAIGVQPVATAPAPAPTKEATGETTAAPTAASPASATATATEAPTGIGHGVPPKEPPSNGSNGGEPELTALYEAAKTRAGKFLRNGHDFLDDVYPFFRRVLAVEWRDDSDGDVYLNFPARLTAEGEFLMTGKPGWKRPSTDKQEHVTALLKHFMAATTNVNIKSINAGVISQFKSLIMATLILPRMIAEGKAPKKGGGTLAWEHDPVRLDGNEAIPLKPDEITPSVLIRSLGGTNPTLRAWRFASTPQRGEAEKKVPESEMFERIVEAEKEMATLIERSWENAAYEMREAVTIASLPAGAIDEHMAARRAQPLGEMANFVLLGVKVGDQLLVKEVRPLVIKLERAAA